MDGILPRDPWSIVRGGDHAGYRQGAPIAMVPVTTERAAHAKRRVLRWAGASLARDAVDRRVVADLRVGEGHIIDSQAEVGGWPELRVGAPAPDSDGDGMPDAWERRHGSDPLVADDGVPDATGHTRLERYLDALAARPRGAASRNGPEGFAPSGDAAPSLPRRACSRNRLSAPHGNPSAL